MKYSVVVPCYNAASTLQKTINSIQKCGLPEFEILLIDDGSKDNTAALCDRLEVENDNIRAFHQQNAGVSAARNQGIEKAKGDYIWFFDSDDLVDEDSMKRVAQIVERQKPDVLMFGMSFDYYVGKRIYQRLELYYDEERLMTPAQVQEAFSELYHNNMLTPCWNKLFYREMLLNCGVLFHTDMFVMEDFLFSLEAMKYCRTVYTLPDAIYHYNQGSISGDKRTAQRVNRITDLTAYVQNFEPLLSAYPELLEEVFFMLLYQKISVQTPDEMAETAEVVCNSSYMQSSGADKAFVRHLQKGDYQTLYDQFQKAETRQKIVSTVKRSKMFSLLKGPIIKRVIW